MLTKRNGIIILLITTIVLLLALYIVQHVHHNTQMKSQESKIYDTVKSYVQSAHDVLLNSPGEPLVPTYGLIRDGSGMIGGFTMVHYSAGLDYVIRLNREIEYEFFTLMLQNKFNEDRAFFVEQLAEALKMLPEKPSQIDSTAFQEQFNQLKMIFVKYMSKKYNYFK
jgi:low affinity Fe/Cu permease